MIRKPITRTRLRAAVARRLPFNADVMICQGAEILQLASADPFAGQPSGPKILHLVSVMAKRKQSLPGMPLVIPSARDWGLKMLDVRGRFALGLCRREMRAIGYLGQLDKVLGVPVTTRSWSTVLRIAGTLEAQGYNRTGG